jgi:DNA-binding transcriptional regulator YdaS (Cro superfamily)
MKKSHMKSKIACSAFAAAILLALTQLATAQGTSGATGAVASIPSSVVRAAEQRQPVTQPGILSIITSATPPGPDADSKQATKRRDKSPIVQK